MNTYEITLEMNVGISAENEEEAQKKFIENREFYIGNSLLYLKKIVKVEMI